MNFLQSPIVKHDLSQYPLLSAALSKYSDTIDLSVDKQLLRWGFSPNTPKEYNKYATQKEMKDAVSDETLFQILDKYKEIDEIPVDLPDVEKKAILAIRASKLPYTFGKSNLIYLKSNDFTLAVQKEIQALIPDREVEAQTGAFWYPENGYMAWHTNENHTGFRVYCAYSYETKKSFFKYRLPDSGEIVTCWDDVGWNVRVFKVGRTEKDRLWHAVYSETDRLSIGYSVKE